MQPFTLDAGAGGAIQARGRATNCGIAYFAKADFQRRYFFASAKKSKGMAGLEQYAKTTQTASLISKKLINNFPR